MAKLFEIVEGWTQELDAMTAEADDVAVDLNGYASVELVLTDKSRTAVSVAVDQLRIDAEGLAYFTPAASQLLNTRSPYYVHLKATRANGKVEFFPNAGAHTIVVHRP
jgi:hypothetical protein